MAQISRVLAATRSASHDTRGLSVPVQSDCHAARLLRRDSRRRQGWYCHGFGIERMQTDLAVGNGQVGAGQFGPAAAVEVRDRLVGLGDGVVSVAATDGLATALAGLVHGAFLDL